MKTYGHHMDHMKISYGNHMAICQNMSNLLREKNEKIYFSVSNCNPPFDMIYASSSLVPTDILSFFISLKQFLNS